MFSKAPSSEKNNDYCITFKIIGVNCKCVERMNPKSIILISLLNIVDIKINLKMIDKEYIKYAVLKETLA